MIDTHVLIWWVKDSTLVRPQVRHALQERTNEIHVSSISAWEIATKVRIGKLRFVTQFLDDFDECVENLGFQTLDFTPQHAVTGARLIGDHKDPFDRMLAGQAVCEGLQLVSVDPKFKLLGVEPLWG